MSGRLREVVGYGGSTVLYYFSKSESSYNYEFTIIFGASVHGIDFEYFV